MKPSMKPISFSLFPILLLFSTSACVMGGGSGPVAGGDFHRPVLAVEDWYFLENGEPIYLVGYSPSAVFLYEDSDLGRLEALPPEVNYMRTWLEAWDDANIVSPFVLVDGRADLSRLDPDWLRRLGDFLDASARAGVVQELTLFNPWGAREHWEEHWWSPGKNIQGFDVDADSLYTLGNPAQALQEKWVEQILDVVDASLAREYVIIEIDNELKTGGGPWREHFVDRVKTRGDYLVSTIATYCADYDAVGGANDIIALHGGFSGDPGSYDGRTLAYGAVKPIIFNELYPWWQHPREAQRAVFWSIFMSRGMFCVDYWGGGRTDEAETLDDMAVLARFANGIAFHEFHPNGDWLLAAPNQTWAQAHRDGSAFMAYFREPGHDPVSVDLPAGVYQVSWINPIDGARLDISSLTSSEGAKKLTPPATPHDLLLWIEEMAAGD